MRNLAELGEIGMELARQIQRQMQNAGVLTHQSGQTFERVARAIRRTHALEQKIDADSRKTAEQWAAEQARREAAALRAGSREAIADQPAGVAAANPGPHDREERPEDLRDRENLLDDLDDADDDEDRDDEDSVAAAGEVIAEVRQTLRAARKHLQAVSAADAGADVAEDEPAEPAARGGQAALARTAARVAGKAGLATAPLTLPIPSALAWPPRPPAAHGPPAG
jgi:hypothetical protein